MPFNPKSKNHSIFDYCCLCDACKPDSFFKYVSFHRICCSSFQRRLRSTPSDMLMTSATVGRFPSQQQNRFPLKVAPNFLIDSAPERVSQEKSSPERVTQTSKGETSCLMKHKPIPRKNQASTSSQKTQKVTVKE